MTDTDKDASLQEALSAISFWAALKRVVITTVKWATVIAVLTVFTLVGGSYSWGDVMQEGLFGLPLFLTMPLALFFLFRFVHGSSFHDWRLQFYFPRLKTVGSFIFASYVTLLAYLFWLQHQYFELPRIERSHSGDAALGAVTFLALYPFVAFFDLINAAHDRLMEVRRNKLAQGE